MFYDNFDRAGLARQIRRAKASLEAEINEREYALANDPNFDPTVYDDAIGDLQDSLTEAIWTYQTKWGPFEE